MTNQLTEGCHYACEPVSVGIRLIVNADDFGYSELVSRGILECARAGVVTATGVFGNAADLDRVCELLFEAPDLETGVHLSLTHGRPLTSAMSRRLGRFGGRFPGKFTMAGMLALGVVPKEMLKGELAAQIEACLGHGLRVEFLNSHEHLHMHPRVYPIVADLAREYTIAWVRHTVPDLVAESGGISGAIRDRSIRLVSGRCADANPCPVRLVGLAQSGQVNVAYIARLVERMEEGAVYELMCHPGFHDPTLAEQGKLRRYHDWDMERESLQDSCLVDLFAEAGVRLVRFRDLA